MIDCDTVNNESKQQKTPSSPPADQEDIDNDIKFNTGVAKAGVNGLFKECTFCGFIVNQNWDGSFVCCFSNGSKENMTQKKVYKARSVFDLNILFVLSFPTTKLGCVSLLSSSHSFWIKTSTGNTLNKKHPNWLTWKCLTISSFLLLNRINSNMEWS